MARPSSSPSPVLAHAAALAAALAAPLAAPLAAQHEQGAADPNAPMYVAPRSADAQEAIAGFQLAETLVCDLVASEPDLANPVAFAIDGKGRVYVAETFRLKDGVFDNREYMQWKDDDLACRLMRNGRPAGRRRTVQQRPLQLAPAAFARAAAHAGSVARSATEVPDRQRTSQPSPPKTAPT
jgi:hypothetical protein